MTDEEALTIAERMRPFHRQVILLCMRKKSIGYDQIAERLEASYIDVQIVGEWMQKKKLASVSYVRNGREFAGSRIFLTEAGEHVRLAADLLDRKSRASD